MSPAFLRSRPPLYAFEEGEGFVVTATREIMHELRIDRGRQLILQRRDFLGNGLKSSHVLFWIAPARFVADQGAAVAESVGKFFLR